MSAVLLLSAADLLAQIEKIETAQFKMRQGLRAQTALSTFFFLNPVVLYFPYSQNLRENEMKCCMFNCSSNIPLRSHGSDVQL